MKQKYIECLKQKAYSKCIDYLNQMLKDDFEQASKLILSKSKSLLKRTGEKDFWNSSIPGEYGWDIGKPEKGNNLFWQKYFKQPKHIQGLIQSGLQKDPDLLVSILKFYQVFINNIHWSDIKKELDSSENHKIQTFIQEGDCLNRLKQKADRQIARYDDLLSKVHYDTIIIHFSIYLERMYFSGMHEFEYQYVKYAYMDDLESILKQKSYIDSSKKRKKGRLSSIQLQEKMMETLSQMKNGKKFDLQDMFEIYHRFNKLLDLIKHYCFHSWNIDFDQDTPQFYCPNQSFYDDWLLTNQKYNLLHEFYKMPRPETSQFFENILANSPNELSKASNLKTLQDFQFFNEEIGVLDKVYFPGGTIEPFLAIKVLNDFSSCYIHQYHKIMAELRGKGYDYLESMTEEILKKFFKRMAESGQLNLRYSLEFRTGEELINIIQNNYPNITDDQKKDILALFSFLCPNIEKIDSLIASVFLQHPEGYILLPRLFHQSVGSTFFSKIFLSNMDGNNEYSAFQEKKIASLFENHKFQVVNSFSVKGGEFDVLAYKDNCLFMIEAKLTYLRISVRGITQQYEIFEKAGKQLKRNIQLLHDKYSMVAKKLNIHIPFESLKIIPLIVSTSFEYDHYFFSGYRKISMFELQHILQNSIGRLTFWRETMKISTENLTSYESDILNAGIMNEERIKEIHADALNRKDSIDPEKMMKDHQLFQEQYASPNEIIRIIENQSFWKTIFSEENFSMEPMVKELDFGGSDVIHYKF